MLTKAELKDFFGLHVTMEMFAHKDRYAYFQMKQNHSITLPLDDRTDGFGKQVTFKVPEDWKENAAVTKMDSSQVTLLPQFLSRAKQAAPGWYSLLNSQVLKRQALSPLAIPSATAVQNNLVDTIGQLSQKGGSPTTPRPSTPHPTIQQPLQVGGSNHVVYTPHPKHGHLLYMQQMTDVSTPALPSDCVTGLGVSGAVGSSPDVMYSNTQTPRGRFPVALNSSGEETQCSPDFPDGTTAQAALFNTPLDGLHDPSSRIRLDLPFFSDDDPCREQHNLKERKRRARIKDACDLMRKLVPGMSDKTDKATVFEFAARYIHFLKSYTGNHHDKDFLLKYSPY
ncbi:hypothetical protein ScPMuIL_016074 [Solemya velum]